MEITDTGIGMDETTLQNLFSEKVISKYGTEGEKGTDFGLVLCKILIHLNDVELEVKSTYNKGSTFRIITKIYRKFNRYK